MKKLFLVLVLLISSCSSHVESEKQNFRELSSIPQVSRNLLSATTWYHDYIRSSQFTPDSCSKFLDEGYRKIFHLPGDYFDVEQTRKKLPEILNALWQSRITLRGKMREFYEHGELTKDCAKSMKRAFRASRFVEDFIGEMMLKTNAIDGPKDKLTHFQGGHPYVLKRPGYEDFNPREDIRSGDVILWRGTSFISASIARIGDVQSQFSHLSIVYKNPKKEKAYTIEALIEDGTNIRDFEKTLDREGARLVIFRHPNARLAHSAAKAVYQKAKTSLDKGSAIPYDFNFNIKDRSELFCSELTNYGYQKASNGKVRVPKFMSLFNMKNREFLRDLEADIKKGFQPADMDIEPRFKLLAEWRDYHQTEEARVKDAMFSMIYRWMNEKNYEFKFNILTGAEASIGWVLRRFGFYKEMFPKNMKIKTIDTVLKLKKLGNALEKPLMKRVKSYKKKHGHSMTQKDLFKTLEQIRQKDLQIHEKYERYTRGGKPQNHQSPPKRPKFHHFFRR